ncbi:hypothetical protein AaE_005345 [Aphanomyces astaci]|uniref:Uncharacterized protein n=1 Tax=Aphanomyces astaci TaxID=112090 RepID=A0A6A5A2R8_APHAT|nr:hypothetical protein AaE_005345 [Aphanomyces astaci]
MSKMDALAYDPEDLEELLYFSGSDSDEHPPEPPPASSTILPPLHFVDMPSRSPYLSASKASQLSKLGVLNSPFGKYPKQRPSPVISPSLQASPHGKKKMKAPSPLTRFVPEIILPTNMTSPSKLMTFKTNDIIKHGELKLYMCRYTTIQPLFCIPFHETTTLQACRTLIDDLLMVDAIEYVFVAPTGKSIAVSAEGRFHAHWFYPVLTILVTSVLNQTSHHVSPDKLQQTMAALDQKSPASNEKPWNLSYASFGMFSSKELRMQSAIIQSPMSKKIRKRQQRDALRVSLESPLESFDGVADAFEHTNNPALDPATVHSILKRSKFDVLEHFSDREVQVAISAYVSRYDSNHIPAPKEPPY